MTPRSILLVEDNPDDAALTLRAFRKNNIQNEIHIAHDGVEALAFLHGPGPDGPPRPLPAVVLLWVLRLPREETSQIGPNGVAGANLKWGAAAALLIQIAIYAII